MFKILKFIRYSIFLISTSIFASQTFQGELEVLVSDDFANKKVTRIYQLHESGQTYKLNLPPGFDKKKLITGKKIIIQGDEAGQNNFLNPQNGSTKEINVQYLDVLNQESALSTGATTTSVLGGKRNVLVVLVNFSNLKVTSTQSVAKIEKYLFTGTTASYKNLRDSSFSQFLLNSDSNGNGVPDIYTITLPYAASGCDFNKWATDAKTAANNKGIRLGLYKHFMFILPQNVSCTWGGVGTVGCGTSCNTWIRAFAMRNSTDPYPNFVYTHELGHNAGMQHASLDANNDGVSESEYGDGSCTMGTGDFKFSPLTNAPHRDLLGYFIKYPDLIRLVITGTYRLYPLEQNKDAGNLRVLKVIQSATNTYYISFRTNKTPWTVGPNYVNKVNIHRVTPGSSQTMFVKALSAGQSFTAGSKVHILVKSIAADGSSAVVKIY